ncbi:MAG: 4-hydroxy-tetrahydrodipicolinate reductase [Candidatus Omnitrophica bacterium]|nr:4-hydroxy-tetrahydrodipicolinate reductase [Candidatus Omnitrophota bacterium]
MVKVVVSGASGRMGKRISELAAKDADIDVVAGIEIRQNADPKKGIFGDINEIKNNYDCIVEFTTPEATVEHLTAAARLKKSMIIGTTGLSDAQKNAIKEASEVIPIVFSPNMSVGVNLLFNLISQASKTLGKEYKVKIKEAHHIHKKDKPSGTAKLMEEIVVKESGRTAIPIQSVREDEIVGDHEIFFESDGDVIRISHSAKTRDILALGAIEAAKFIATRKKGLFSMRDVLK